MTRSVGRLVGRSSLSVCHNLWKGGKLHFHFPIGVLVISEKLCLIIMTIILENLLKKSLLLWSFFIFLVYSCDILWLSLILSNIWWALTLSAFRKEIKTDKMIKPYLDFFMSTGINIMSTKTIFRFRFFIKNVFFKCHIIRFDFIWRSYIRKCAQTSWKNRKCPKSVEERLSQKLV